LESDQLEAASAAAHRERLEVGQSVLTLGNLRRRVRLDLFSWTEFAAARFSMRLI